MPEPTTPPAPPAAPEPPKTEPPAVDPEQIKSEVKQELDAEYQEKLAKQEAQFRQSVIEAISGKKEEGWKPKNWEDVANKAAERTAEVLDTKRQEAAKVKAEKKKEAQTQTQKQQEDQNTRWQGQLTTLVEQKLIPDYSQSVKDKLSKGGKLTEDDVKSDPGLNARIKLYQIIKEHPELEQNLELAYYRFYGKRPPGVEAPVFGTQKSVTPQGEGYTWEELHSTPTEQIVAETAEQPA